MLENALKNAFDINCHLEQIKLKGLPLYMVSGRVFYSAVMGDASFLIVKLSDREKFGVVAFKKQLSQYMEKTGLNVAFCFDDITRVQRDALIAKEIPFISLPDQIFFAFPWGNA